MSFELSFERTLLGANKVFQNQCSGFTGKTCWKFPGLFAVVKKRVQDAACKVFPWRLRPHCQCRPPPQCQSLRPVKLTACHSLWWAVHWYTSAKPEASWAACQLLADTVTPLHLASCKRLLETYQPHLAVISVTAGLGSWAASPWPLELLPQGDLSHTIHLLRNIAKES